MARTCVVVRSAQPRHVAIVLGTSGKNIVVLNQNYLYVQHVTKNTLSKSYLRGFLRPKA